MTVFGGAKKRGCAYFDTPSFFLFIRCSLKSVVYSLKSKVCSLKSIA